MYCRFCTRKRKVGDPFKRITKLQILKGIEYIREHSEIRDVLLSGGDPLLLSDSFLEWILKELRKIPHIEIIRIGTRVPCALPQRITPELCEMFKKYHPLYVNVHFAHPNEITEASEAACAMLANAGIPLSSQTVLLKGINDDPEVMKKLMQELVRMRVRPYYIYQADMTKGINHFRTRTEKGVEIIRAIQGWTSGLAVPHFVIDTPGGGGKIPILPNYVVNRDDKKVVLKNYSGKTYTYTEHC
jgi:lysine 2,3-aminomutase